MSRAFSPPESLTEENRRTVADVRRTVWINGIFGLGVGSVTGTIGHILLQQLQQRCNDRDIASGEKTFRSSTSMMHKLIKPLPPLGRNTFLLSLLGGGALGSFLMSTTAGKNAVHLLHPIFQVGKDEYAGQSSYQIAVNKAKQQHMEGGHDGSKEEDKLDAVHHRERSLLRSASIKERLEKGHSLSDSHGNTWPHTEELKEENRKSRSIHRAETWGKRQTQRREWVHDKIEEGKPLSSSTGGQWEEK